jgi:class 3 adenylate cyclase
MAIDVAFWLRGLGLEQYGPDFANNDIDGAVLPELTAEDLIALGITSVGHRRRLLSAIAALREPPSEAAAPVSAAAFTVEAERRQLTIMFCDLVGSTALSARLDPEDLREIIGAYHRCVAATASRFAGFVAKYMGDGVLVYFGYPQAHEDDAERAARAGLAVIDAVRALDLPQPLAVRLGIANGLVVGDLIGEGAAQERGVVGETPNLAARLQAIAMPNRLVIADSTRRQLGGLFAVEDLGPQALPGFAEAPRAWQVVGESSVVSRFEALRTQATPLIGRDEELDLLARRWRQAKAGEGRVVLISGEPGIGKSRLTAALAESIAGEPHTRLRYFASPHHQESALYPFVIQLERAAGFARDDTSEAKLGKLSALIAEGAAEPDELTLIAELLALPNAAAALELSPQRKREKLLAGLLHQLEALAKDHPVLMVFEDAHWIDPTSRDLIDLTVDRVPRLPVLLLVTFRPEFQPPWTDEPHVTAVALNRLGERHGSALVEQLAGNAGVSSELVAEIVERSDGVPLFIEELTKVVVEAGADRSALTVSARRRPRSPCRQHCMPPCSGASIGSARRPSWSRRPAPRSAAIFLTTWWLPPPSFPSRSCRTHSGASSGPASSFSAARRRRRNTCSSTRWCRTPRTARCCAARARPCIGGSPQRWRRNFPRLWRRDPSLPPTITARRRWPRRRCLIGSWRASYRSQGRPWRRRSRSSAAVSASSRACPRRLSAAGSSSTFTSL